MTNTALADTTESRTAALCAWSSTRREGRTIRASYTPDGWKVAKAKCEVGWSIFRPDGTEADRYMWPNLLAAQLAAFNLGQRG